MYSYPVHEKKYKTTITESTVFPFLRYYVKVLEWSTNTQWNTEEEL